MKSRHTPLGHDAMVETEQRQHPRFPERLAVDVHVFVIDETGADPGFEAKGRTVNIGRGGVLLRLDRPVRDGVHVRLRFWELPPAVRLWPLMISGTIVRLEPGEPADDAAMIGAGSLLGIEFAEPLKELQVPGETGDD